MIRDHAYGNAEQSVTHRAGCKTAIRMPVAKSAGWHDFSILDPKSGFERRFAGRIENGTWGTSDPAMGGTA